MTVRQVDLKYNNRNNKIGIYYLFFSFFTPFYLIGVNYFCLFHPLSPQNFSKGVKGVLLSPLFNTFY